MNQDIQAKLLALRDAYLKSMPHKIAAFEVLWQNLQKQWDHEKLIELHRMVHSLHGSAGTYGLAELGQAAARLETFLKALFETVPSKDQSKEIQLLIEALKSTLNDAPKPMHAIDERKRPHAEVNTVIYLYQKDQNEMQKLSDELRAFGYTVELNSDVHVLSAALKKHWPLAIIIDIELLNPELTYALQSIREQNEYKSLPIFFLSHSGDFNERLKSVRIRGYAYITRPLLVDELINKLENLQKLEQESYHILIVEDESDLAEYYALLLEQAGMTVSVVTQPKLIDLALVEFKPDLILMDVYMPECTGLELATLIRQQSAYEGVPIVFLSAEEDKRKQLNALSLGADDFMTKSIAPEHLIQAVKTKAKRYKNMRATMIKDALTGVFNHTAIQNMLELEIKSSSRLDLPLAVAMLDLDYFKKINDTYGHLTGDQVLKHLCLLLRKRLRASDLIGRYGGEEFLIVMPNTTNRSASDLINLLRKKFSELSFSTNKKQFQATFSAGIATFPQHTTPLDLIQAADDALYKAKQQGRNQVV